jgi:predicted Zn-dependent peptidase
MPSFHTVSLGLFARVGSRCEYEKEAGLAHFIEHMLFKGTAGYSGALVGQIIEGNGGALNGYTSEENTCIHAKIFPEDFDQTMRILFDMVTTPLFDPQEIERERQVIIEEIHSYDDQPATFVEELFSSLIWKGHPLAHSILGTEETVKGYSRSQVQDFFKRYYTAPNIVVAMAGKLAHETLVDWVNDHKKLLPQGAPIQFTPLNRQLVKLPKIQLVHRETEQCHLQFGFPCCGRFNQDQWPLRLLSTIVGENMSSRLFQEVREKRGYAYHISSSFDLYEEAGCFYVQCSTESYRVEECLQASLDVLSTLLEEVSQEELDRSKRFVVGQALQEMESTLASMLWIGDKVVSNDMDLSTQQFCDQIYEVSAKDLATLARQMFSPNQLYLAMLGNGLSQEKLQKIVQRW